MIRALFALLLIALPTAGHAAQDAFVAINQADVRERANMDAPVLETLSFGTKVRVSTKNKEGWYKVYTPSGKYGWIWQADLSIPATPEEMRMAQLQTRDPEQQRERRGYRPTRFYLKGLGNYFGLMSFDLSKRFELKKHQIYPAYGYTGELQYRFADRARVALRVSPYESSGTINASNGRKYDVLFSGTPILIGLDNDLHLGDTFQVSAAIYAGWGLGNKTQITALDFTSNNVGTYEGGHYAGMFVVNIKYWFGKHFGLVGELGGYYSRVKQKRLEEPGFQGDTFLRDDDGQPSTILMTHAGPWLGLGLQLAF